MHGQPPQEVKINASKELKNWYYLLANDPSGTSSRYFDGVQPYKGRTKTLRETLDDCDLLKQITLFRKATPKDLNNRPDSEAWSNFKATGLNNSLKLKVNGFPYPAITTKISAEDKNMRGIQDEFIFIYEVLNDLKVYMDELPDNIKSSKVLRDFFRHQYGIENKKSNRSVYETTINTDFDCETPVKITWQEGNKLKNHKLPTNYMKILISTPKTYQIPSEQTNSIIRFNARNPLERVETALNVHLDSLQPIYESLSK